MELIINFGKFISYRDFIVTPLLIVVIYYLATAFSFSIKGKNALIFLYALSLRVVFSIVHSILGSYGYVSRDYYNLSGNYGASLFLKNPLGWVQFMLRKATDYPSELIIEDPLLTNKTTLPVVKIGSLFDIISASTYSGSILLFSMFVLAGCWLLYIRVSKLFGKQSIWLAIPILFVPSIIFFSSAYMKDSVSLACFAFILAYLFRSNKFSISGTIELLFIPLWCYLIFKVKLYILLALIIAYLFYLFFKWLVELMPKRIMKFSIPLILLITALVGYFGMEIIGNFNPRYSIDLLIGQMKGYQRWIYSSSQDGAPVYDLGEYSDNMLGLIAVAPKAINVSIFRPYLWEAKSIVMIATALESFATLLLTVLLLFKVGIKRFFTTIWDYPFLLFLFFFSLLFLFIVGFSTYNFGSLARYKIPGQFTYLILIFSVFYVHYILPKQKSVDSY